MVGVNKYLVLTLAFTLLLLRVSDAQLSVSFYSSTCPSVFDIVKSNVRSAINREKRIGASILRLLFHDCFVAVCSSNSSRPIWMSQKSWKSDEGIPPSLSVFFFVSKENLFSLVCHLKGNLLNIGCTLKVEERIFFLHVLFFRPFFSLELTSWKFMAGWGPLNYIRWWCRTKWVSWDMILGDSQ